MLSCGRKTARNKDVITMLFLILLYAAEGREGDKNFLFGMYGFLLLSKAKSQWHFFQFG